MSYNYNMTYRRNRIVEPSQLLAAYDIFHPTADQKYTLGCIFDTNDGRRFRYCEKDGTTDLVAGLVNQSCASTANWQNVAKVGTNAIGTKSIVINSALATTVPANAFNDGYLTVQDEAGERHMYIIKEHTTGTTPTFELADVGGLRIATITATTEITLTKNKYKDVLVAPASVTGVLVGVNLAAVTVDYFFWAQTRGPCPVCCDDTDTLVVGDWCMISTDATIPGAVALMDAGAGNTNAPVGRVMDIAATSETALIDLCIE